LDEEEKEDGWLLGTLGLIALFIFTFLYSRGLI